MADEIRKRRALTHVGGPIETVGDREEAQALAWALDVSPSTDADDDPARRHVHGFHTYPARMHPETAARLVEAFAPAGGSVLDPFCGSGTVLVEALVRNHRALGTDLNPLAVRLAACKTRPYTPAELEELLTRARACAAAADERRKAKAGASRRFPPADVALFDPHVLLELGSLRAALGKGQGPVDLALSLVLSSVLGKLSRRRGDTSGEVAPRRIAGGFPAKLFVRKAEDLAQRLAEFAKLLPAPPPEAVVAQDDATALRSLPTGKVGTVITSPPYAATYDYVDHHAVRLRWLGLDPGPLARGEFGARSAYRRVEPRKAPEAWSRELAQFFRAVARRLPRGGPLVLLLADSAVGPVALRADEIVAAVARECGFDPAACASQARPHFHGPTKAAFGDRPRREHAILLRRTDARPTPGGRSPPAARPSGPRPR